MTMHVKTGGAIRRIDQPYMKVAGVWKPAIEGWVKQGGLWKKVWPNAITSVNYIGTTFNTNAGAKGVSDPTCPVGAVMFALFTVSNANYSLVSFSDNQGGVWSLWDQRTWTSNERSTGVFYRQGRVATAGNLAVTMSVSGDTGGGFSLVRIEGLPEGWSGRQSSGAVAPSAGNPSIPQIVMPQAILSENLCLAVMASGTGYPGWPANWIGMVNGVYATPNTYMNTAYIPNGEVNSVLFGTGSVNNWTAVVVEINGQ